jgi:hypothetical protein
MNPIVEMKKDLTIPGKVLADGCIVIQHQPKTIFCDERFLIAAPEETQVECQWNKEFTTVFYKLMQDGFNPTDWFIPSVEQLKLAYNNANANFTGFEMYWSSEDINPNVALCVDFLDSSVYEVNKKFYCYARAFRFVEL